MVSTLLIDYEWSGCGVWHGMDGWGSFGDWLVALGMGWADFFHVHTDWIGLEGL